MFEAMLDIAQHADWALARTIACNNEQPLLSHFGKSSIIFNYSSNAFKSFINMFVHFLLSVKKSYKLPLCAYVRWSNSASLTILVFLLCWPIIKKGWCRHLLKIGLLPIVWPLNHSGAILSTPVWLNTCLKLLKYWCSEYFAIQWVEPLNSSLHEHLTIDWENKYLLSWHCLSISLTEVLCDYLFVN